MNTVGVHQAPSPINLVLAYISTYETSVPTCARISIGHNQHIPGLYETLISIAQSTIRDTDVQLPDYDWNFSLTHWDSLILQHLV